MTTPSECFKKKVKLNTCTVFNHFIVCIILMLPIIIYAGYFMSLPPVTNVESLNERVLLLIFGGSASIVVDIIYAYIMAIPFVECYFGAGLK